MKTLRTLGMEAIIQPRQSGVKLLSLTSAGKEKLNNRPRCTQCVERPQARGIYVAS